MPNPLPITPCPANLHPMLYRVISALFIVIVMVCHAAASHAQAAGLKGQYVFEGKNDMSSMFVFTDDGTSFIAFRASDLGSFYGEGKFQLVGSNLVLHYDSTGVGKRVSKTHHITPTGTDTLIIRNLTAKKFELVLQPSGFVETYRKVKYPGHKKR